MFMESSRKVPYIFIPFGIIFIIMSLFMKLAILPLFLGLILFINGYVAFKIVRDLQDELNSIRTQFLRLDKKLDEKK